MRIEEVEYVQILNFEIIKTILDGIPKSLSNKNKSWLLLVINYIYVYKTK